MILRRSFRTAHHAVQKLCRCTGIVVGQGHPVGGKAQFRRGIRRHNALSRQMDKVEHLGAAGQHRQLLGSIAGGRSDGVEHGTA